MYAVGAQEIHVTKARRRFLLHEGFPCGPAGIESTCHAGDLGSIPGLGRPPGEGKVYLLEHYGLQNSMDRGAWQATVHGVTNSRTQLSDFQFFR